MVPQRRAARLKGRRPCRSSKLRVRGDMPRVSRPRRRRRRDTSPQRWYRGQGGGASTPARASRAEPLASMAGVCTVAMLLLIVPLFTLEADARGGGFGGHGGGFGGH